MVIIWRIGRMVIATVSKAVAKNKWFSGSNPEFSAKFEIMARISQKRELEIYRRLLIRLHTARWTGNSEEVKELLDRIGAYSYARTNSNGDYKQEERDRKRTLLNLDK